MSIEIPRRRFIAIAAATGAAILSGRAVAEPVLHTWRGVALGADATIRLAHPDPARARGLVETCVREIGRLERIFSLYQPDSALSRLNGDGELAEPPFELIELLARAAVVSEVTDGAFDITVQPLWRRLADHFAAPGADSAGPDLTPLLPLVDWRSVIVTAESVRLARPGMAITLNGIAQGYVTDRIATLLRSQGLDHVLINLGETRALGAHPAGRPWTAGVPDPTDPSRLALRLPLRDRALATSGGYGTAFDPAGRCNHLIDPRDGSFAPPRRSISVVAADATTADAASTALSLIDDRGIRPVLRRLGAIEAHVVEPHATSLIRA